MGWSYNILKILLVLVLYLMEMELIYLINP
jgi:hypothetical protein